MTHILAVIFLLGGVYALFAFAAARKCGTAGRFDLSHPALFGVAAATCANALARGASLGLALLEGTLAGGLTWFCADRIALYAPRIRGGVLGENAALVAAAAAFTVLVAWPGRVPASITVHAAVQRALEPWHLHARGDATTWIGGAVCLVLLAFAVLVERRTRLGTAARAVASDMETARSVGIDPEWAIAQTAFVMSAFGALGGCVLAGFSVSPDPVRLAIAVFAASAIGGIDSIAGSVPAAYVVAAIQAGVASAAPAGTDALVIAGAVLVCAFAAPRALFPARAARSHRPR